MAESYSRGHKIICTDGKTWKYADTKQINGEDACLGHIEGAVSACCGYGVSEPIIVFKEATV